MNESHDLLGRLRTIKPFVYVATPYSKHPLGMQAAFEDAGRAAAWLLLNGVKVFCPITHSHPIALYGKIPPERHDIWLPADKPLMDAAGGMVVVMMGSWQDSIGISFEIDTFTKQGKPVYYMAWPREDQ